MKTNLLIFLIIFPCSIVFSQNKLLSIHTTTDKESDVIVSDSDLKKSGNTTILPNLNLKKVSSREETKFYFKEELFFDGKKLDLPKDSLYFSELYNNNLFIVSIYNRKEQHFIRPGQTKRNQCYIIDYKNKPEVLYSVELENTLISVSKEWVEKYEKEGVYSIEEIDLDELCLTLMNKDGGLKKYKLKEIPNPCLVD